MQATDPTSPRTAGPADPAADPRVSSEQMLMLVQDERRPCTPDAPSAQPCKAAITLSWETSPTHQSEVTGE